MEAMKLSPRLRAVAGFVRQGSRLADIGTDHAALPVYLVQKGRVISAVASDVNRGPLDRAADTVLKYGCPEQVILRESDGLRGIAPQEADDIVIAGMGGELIARILGDCPWICSREKRLVLQPMTHAEALRAFLYRMGFQIRAERVVQEGEKLYLILCAQYGAAPREPSLSACYMGALDPADESARRYFEHLSQHLRNRLKAGPDAGLFAVIEEIERKL